MTTKKPRVRRNQSRVEFLANRETIETLLEQGYNMKRIFERLQEDGSFSISYWAFRRILVKMRPQHLRNSGLSSPVAAPSALPVPQALSAPVPVSARNGPQILGKMEKANPASPSTYIKDRLA